MNMERKNSIAQIILEKISEVGALTLDAVFPRNRAESKIWRKLLGLPEGYEFSRETFSVALSRLKEQGLVAKSRKERNAFWIITPKGKNKLESYIVEKIKADGIPRIVMYDIPEPERRKRDWLRCELVACDYKQLQKSVWLGYCPLPEKFIKSLKDMDIKNKVHIVSIHKTGTLTELL